MKWLNIIIFAFIFGGCVPDFDLGLDDTGNISYPSYSASCEFEADFDSVWQKPLAYAGSSVFFNEKLPIRSTHKGLLSFYKKGSQYTLVLRETNTGEAMWETDMHGFSYNSNNYQYTMDIKGNTIVVSSDKLLCTFDLDDGRLLWKTDIAITHDPTKFAVIDNYLYFIESNRIEGSASGRTNIFVLVKTDLRNLHKEVVYSSGYAIKMGFNNCLDLPLLYQNKSNHTIGIFKGHKDGTTKLYAYNLTEKQLLWKSAIINSTNLLTLREKKIFLLEKTNIISSFDARTGEVLWTTTLDDQSGQSTHGKWQLLFIKDKLMVKTNEYLYAIDYQSSNVLWEEKFNPCYPYILNQNYHCNTTLILNTKGIYAYDINTGIKKWETKSPYCANSYSREQLVEAGAILEKPYFLFQDKKRLIVGKIPDFLLENCENDDEF